MRKWGGERETGSGKRREKKGIQGDRKTKTLLWDMHREEEITGPQMGVEKKKPKKTSPTEGEPVDKQCFWAVVIETSTRCEKNGPPDVH